MKTEKAYCPGCGEEIRLAFTDPPPHDGHANLPDGAEVVCMDYREACCEGTCPATGRPGVVMGVRLARSHLKDDAFRTFQGRCQGCGRVADLEVVDGRYAVCPLCDTTNRWVMLRLESGDRIAVTSAE